MDNIIERLTELKKLSEGIKLAEKNRQRFDIIGKTVSLICELNVAARKLKSPNRTANDVKKHLRLLTELRLLYRTDEINSPLNIIKKEAELINGLQQGLIQSYQGIIAEINGDELI